MRIKTLKLFKFSNSVNDFLFKIHSHRENPEGGTLKNVRQSLWNPFNDPKKYNNLFYDYKNGSQTTSMEAPEEGVEGTM